MTKTKKVLSLLLAFILLCATLFVQASAAVFTRGDEDPNKINIKYEVAKADEAPMEDGSATYVGDDIYAVTVYAKSKDGIDFFQAPIHYNKKHYQPIMIYDGVDLYPGTDSYYSDMGEGASYVYKRGAAWDHTAMYKANGTVATTKALAKLIGLGNPNAGAVAINVEFVSPDHPNFADYNPGLDTDNYGIMYVALDDVAIQKNAYLNVTEGITVNQDWVSMITVYFQRLPGVSDADCVGDVFGCTTDCEKGVDGSTDATGQAAAGLVGPWEGGNPGCNIVSNAVVTAEEPAGPVVTKTQAEVKMTLNEDQTAVDYAAAPFQFRVISSISEDDWNTYFSGDGSNIESVGFVAYKGDGAFDMETAKSVAMGGSAADYQAAKTDYIQKVDGQAANFGARIDFTARENVKDVTYIAFVQYDTDQYAFYDASFDADLNSNYDDIVSRYAGFIAG